MSTYKIAVLPGDGIGPETIAQAHPSGVEFRAAEGQARDRGRGP